MKTVKINCEKAYDVLIDRGLLKKAGDIISGKFPEKRFCIVTDGTVAEIYLQNLRNQISGCGLDCEVYIFGHGEKDKNMRSVENILTFLAEKHFTRSDMLIALGGGITGDITGFAAAIYQRGIGFIQIPTTVLAAVDSSVGGKTGVNLGGLKNQVGAFWQPSLVLCDPDCFDTLPKTEFSSGMAEVIKYAAIFRASLGREIEKDTDISPIIAECVGLKRDVVEKDERDTGERQLLNLGHTFGHAVEKVTDNGFSHGQAVSCGMIMAFRAAEALGLCKKGEIGILKRLLEKYGLPQSSGCSFEPLLRAMLNDKKRTGGKITLVLPKKFGECMLYKADMNDLPDILRLALTE